jgi:hypothetical protein
MKALPAHGVSEKIMPVKRRRTMQQSKQSALFVFIFGAHRKNVFALAAAKASFVRHQIVTLNFHTTTSCRASLAALLIND